jgi:suppressor of ftsI
MPNQALIIAIWLALAVLSAGCAQPTQEASGRLELDRSTDGLPAAQPPEEVRLAGGATYNLTAAPAVHAPGGRPIRMYAYNGQIPGPLLRLQQGSTVTVQFHNALPYESSIHWHGMRVDQAMDGVQPPVKPGGSFAYTVRAPDEGVFWYHPHMMESMQQELGLAGAIVVEGDVAADHPRDHAIVLDDMLLLGGDVAPFLDEATNFALMGRFGNTMLANGAAHWNQSARPHERVRLHLVDAANTRTFNVSFPGAERVEWIASDAGFLREPVTVENLVLSPGERATVDIIMPGEGNVRLQHTSPGKDHTLGRIAVEGEPVQTTPAPRDPHLRAAASMDQAMQKANNTLRVLRLDVVMPSSGMDHSMPGMQHGTAPAAVPEGGIEWETDAANAESSSDTIRWVIRDGATGAEPRLSGWTFQRGSHVLLRVENPGDSMHPMQHPIHLHGQRFLVLHDGALAPSSAWKDTVLVRAGTTVTVLVEMANPGEWLLHCHISEHLESGMTTSFRVA